MVRTRDMRGQKLGGTEIEMKPLFQLRNGHGQLVVYVGFVLASTQELLRAFSFFLHVVT